MSATVETNILLPCSASTAFTRFLDVVWRQGGGMGTPTILVEGDSDGVGCLRRVALGIEELITGATHGSQINYKIAKFSILMPMSTHAGVVRFEEHEGNTLVIWKCDFTPSFWGVEWLLRWTISYAFNNMLSALRASFRD
eukprot:m.38582 g.38582  ORF g.38582 m.38582 type:complete len:140 (+) comp10005_c1_seq1:28-447(+)